MAFILAAWLIWIGGNLLLAFAGPRLMKPTMPCCTVSGVMIPAWCANALSHKEYLAVWTHEFAHQRCGHVWRLLFRNCLLFGYRSKDARNRYEAEADKMVDAKGLTEHLSSARRKLRLCHEC